MKKWFVLLLTILMIVSCVGTSAESNNDISATLDVALAADMAPDSVTEWVRMFNDEYPNIKLNVTLVDASNYTATFEPLVAADAMPDVMAVAPHDYYRNLAEKGYLLDCGEMDGWDRQVDFVQDAFTSESGLPSEYQRRSTMVLFYNEDHFAQAGITELPTCWEEFIECCEKLAAGFAPWRYRGWLNNLAHSFMGFGIAYEVYGSGYDKNWVANNMTGEYDYDIDAWKRVLDRLVYLRDKGYFQRATNLPIFTRYFVYLRLKAMSINKLLKPATFSWMIVSTSVRSSAMELSRQPNVAISWACDGVGLGRNAKRKNLKLLRSSSNLSL